jgi:hypothetical protein
VVLDLERDRVEVLLLLQEDCSAIVLPEETEVLFNIIFEFTLYVFAFAERLIPDFFNEEEPLLQLVFFV